MYGGGSVGFRGSRKITDVKPHEILCGFLASLGATANASLIVMMTHFFGEKPPWLIGYTAVLFNLGLTFPFIVVTSTNTFSKIFISLVTGKSRFLSRKMSPLIRIFGLSSLTTIYATLISIVVWLVFSVTLLPILSPNSPFQFPNLDPTMFLSTVIYGVSLGGFYGLLVQEVF